MRRVRSGCCARAASGHVATPPISVMNSRRLILVPRPQKSIVTTLFGILEGLIDVRFGSKADICAAIGHVRFAPESGHVRCSYGCPLRAKSGHCSYSITSSASSKNDSRIVSPSALAVLRLTASSYLFGACTGRLPGASPLRIRSTYSLERRKISAVSGP